MTIQEIAEKLRRRAEEWRAILEYKAKPNDKPKSRSKITHPGTHILELLEQAYLPHPQSPLKLDDRCNELHGEVKTAIPDFPSAEYGDKDKLFIIKLVCAFADLLIKEPTKVTPPEGEWSKPMQKADMMRVLRIDSYRQFNAWATQHSIEKVGNNRQLWKICFDKMDKLERSKLEGV